MIAQQRIRIKMCGTTNLADALAAVQAGVDALGFIFHNKSPRHIEPEIARQIIACLPPFVDAVGVFVDCEQNEIGEIARFCGLTCIQLHGQEPPEYCATLRQSLPCQLIKALRVGTHSRAEDAAPYHAHVRGFLLDTYQKGQAGGTGQTFDWTLIGRLGLERKFILAGGLDVGNVQAAVETVGPYGIDVNSGVENSPGRKDHGRIRAFVQEVRRLECGGL